MTLSLCSDNRPLENYRCVVIIACQRNYKNSNLYEKKQTSERGCRVAYLTPGRVGSGGAGLAFLCCLLSVCCVFRVGRRPPTHPLLGKGRKASQATHPATHPSDPPSDPPQRRPTPATHPRSYRHVAGVRYIWPASSSGAIRIPLDSTLNN